MLPPEGSEQTETQPQEAVRDNRRFAPDYIKPYEWATTYIDTKDFKRVVEVVTARLNGEKEDANFSVGAVDKALRRLKVDLKEKTDREAADAKLKADEDAAAAKVKAQREKDAADF